MIPDYSKPALAHYLCACGKYFHIDHVDINWDEKQNSPICIAKSKEIRYAVPNVARVGDEWFYIHHQVRGYFYQVVPVDQVLSVYDGTALRYPKQTVLTNRADFYTLCVGRGLIKELEAAVDPKDFKKWQKQSLVKNITGRLK